MRDRSRALVREAAWEASGPDSPGERYLEGREDLGAVGLGDHRVVRAVVAVIAIAIVFIFGGGGGGGE